MFSDFITTTQFKYVCSDVARVDMASAFYDSSLLSTMRALLYKRMTDASSPVCISLAQRSVSENTIRAYPKSTILNHLLCNIHLNEMSNKNLFYLSSPQEGTTNPNLSAEYVENNFIEAYPDFIRVKKISEFFKKSFKVVCFIRPAYRQVVLFLGSSRREHFHAVQAAIPAMMPWFFEKNSLSKAELELLHSLEGDNADKYYECINEIADVKGLREDFIKSSLGGAESYVEKERANVLRIQINDTVSKIASLSRNIENYNLERERYVNELFALDEKINSNDSEHSELAEYFCCNKNLQLEEAHLPYIYFTVTGYLEYFDKDLAERVINNPNSIAYKYNGCSYTNEDATRRVKALLTEIFIKENAKIRTCAAYSISLNGNYDARPGYEFDDDISRSNTPNPHIQHYSCMGSYSPLINELLQNKNYIGAIEQCAASCRSLNFGDSTVMSSFMKELFYGITSGAFSNDTKCIELQDGARMTPKEALEWAWSRANMEVNDNE